MTRLKCGNLDPLNPSVYREVILVGLFGLFFLITSIVVARNPIKLVAFGQTVNAVVVDHKEEEMFKNGEQVKVPFSAAEYADSTGTKHRLWLKGNLDTGSTIPVVYLPHEPEIAIKSGDKSGFGGPALPFIIGLLILTWFTWFISRLLARRKRLKALIARVQPILAKIIQVHEEASTHTIKDSTATKTYRSYKVVAQAKLNGTTTQEFESYRYKGWAPVEKDAVVKLYVDPASPALYYLNVGLDN